jgi:hypothetical protein
MKLDLEKLVNKGFYRLEPDQARAPGPHLSSTAKTVVILSPPRSCSSLVAGVLSHLGVFMGDKVDGVVFEDNALAKHMEGGKGVDADALITDYNSRYPIWGFKRPGALGYVKGLLRRIRNPHLIFLFRDPLATALREHISIKADLLTRMAAILARQQDMIELMKARKYPALLLSAEKIRYYKREMVNEVISFLGLECTEAQVASAVDFIQLEPSRYLDRSRTDRIVGSIDVMDGRRIAGWARSVWSEAPCKVILRVNGVTRKSCAADLLREDLRVAGVHSTGRCGFEFLMEEEGDVSYDDYVEIFTEEDGASFLFADTVTQWRSKPWGAGVTGSAGPDLEGRHDDVSEKGISGWAWDKSRPLEAISVEIYDGETLLATVTADGFRADLKENGKGHGKHAFHMPAPAALNDGHVHLIRVRFAGTEIDLGDSPRSYTILGK